VAADPGLEVDSGGILYFLGTEFKNFGTGEESCLSLLLAELFATIYQLIN